MNAFSKLAASIIVLVLVLVAGCSQNPRKPVQSAEGETETVLATFNADTINEVQYALDDFAPNPDLVGNVAPSPNVLQKFNDGLNAIKAEEFEKAESLLVSVHESHVHLSGPAYNLAVLKIKQDDNKQAKVYLQQALDRNMYNFKARNLLGYLHREAGEFAEAEKLWVENLTLWGGYAPSYKNLGILYDLYQGQPEKGLGYYKQYNKLQEQPDRLVKGWIVTIDRTVAARKKAEAAQLAAQQAEEAAAVGQVEATPEETQLSQQTQTEQVNSEQEAIQ